MKIIVERSGGFAGMIRRGEQDLSTLLPEQLEALQKLLYGRGPLASDATRRGQFHLSNRGARRARNQKRDSL
jgi:hypothetical protein